MKKNRAGKQILVFLLTVVLSLELPVSVLAAPSAGENVSDNNAEASVKVPVDEECFPDKIFREYIKEMFDTDADGILSESERKAVSDIDVSGMNISDLRGIEYFTRLTSLDCSYNRLSELNLDALTDLCEIKADHNAYLYMEPEEIEYSVSENSEEVYAEKLLLPDREITTVELHSKEQFEDVLIDEESFPDAGFMEYVKTYADTDKDGILSAEEAAGTTVMDISGWGIESFAGISCFTNLVYLNYEDNPVTDPDLSANIYLLEAVGGEEEAGEEAPSLSENSLSANDLLFISEDMNAAVVEETPETEASEETENQEEAKEPEVPFTVGAPSLTTVKNGSKGKVSVSFGAGTNASGYEVEYCRKSGFSKDVVTVLTQTTGVTITNLPKNKKYYFRVRAYGFDKTGKKVFSPYSNVLSVKIKKGVEEQTYSADAGKVKGCKIRNKNTFYFKASVKKRISSSDDSYYFCQVDPNTDKKEKIIATMGKTTSVEVSLPVTDENGTNLIEGKYALFVKSKGKYKRITDAVYISNPEEAASYTAAFPKSASKKGLQGAVGQTDLGVSHSLINIPLTDVIATDGKGVPYEYNGKTYYFKSSPYIGAIRQCNRQNVTVSAVFLLPWDENLKSLITPKGRKPGAANYYAWNTSSRASRETLEAAFMYLGELYSQEDCHLDNWILGNELNAGYMWNYAGHISYENYMKLCAQSFRIMYYAAVSHNKNARVYISLTHTWMRNGGEFGAKDFMVDFNHEIKAQQKKIKWNLAYHAYPAPLTEPAFWNNSLAVNNEESRYVTLKNLNILTDFVKKRFGKKTHIILSEQGFTSTGGENIQAAAIAYGYYIAEFNDMIDSFIIRSDTDNAVEASQGLKMGLRDMNGKPKQAYNVFKYMDTPQYLTYTKDCLVTLNKTGWKKLVKKFKPGRLNAMPDR